MDSADVFKFRHLAIKFSGVHILIQKSYDVNITTWQYDIEKVNNSEKLYSFHYTSIANFQN